MSARYRRKSPEELSAAVGVLSALNMKACEEESRIAVMARTSAQYQRAGPIQGVVGDWGHEKQPMTAPAMMVLFCVLLSFCSSVLRGE